MHVFVPRYVSSVLKYNHLDFTLMYARKIGFSWKKKMSGYEKEDEKNEKTGR